MEAGLAGAGPDSQTVALLSMSQRPSEIPGSQRAGRAIGSRGSLEAEEAAEGK